MFRVIGLVGLKQSGKSTVFKFIEELAPKGVKVHEAKFAARLKEACHAASGLPYEYFEDAVLKEATLDKPIKFDTNAYKTVMDMFNITPEEDRILLLFRTPRKMLQIVGTEILRRHRPGIHVQTLLDTMPRSGIVVITDVRFQDEFKELENEFNEQFFPYYIENARAESQASGGHASETQPKKLKKKCKILSNQGTLDELRENVQHMLSEVINA